MSTTLAKNETVQRKWYVIDAAGKPLGRTAATAASLLRGKHKVDFTPNVDCGDFVIIINADKAVLTGTQAGSEEVSAATPAGSATSRRPSIRTLMERAARVRHGAGCQGYAAEEFHRPQRRHAA